MVPQEPLQGPGGPRHPRGALLATPKGRLLWVPLTQGASLHPPPAGEYTSGTLLS